MVPVDQRGRVALIAALLGGCTTAHTPSPDHAGAFLRVAQRVDPYEVTALVVGVADGDTLTGLVDERQIKVRLGQIDAPEKGQPFGRASKRSLSDFCYTVEARVRVYDADRWGRVVAMVECDGVDVNREQVARGMAWAYRAYLVDESLLEVEAQAREKRAGLWRDEDPVPPWEWRRRK